MLEVKQIRAADCILYRMHGTLKLPETDELEMVRRARQGSTEAFAWLVRSCEQRVFEVAWSVLRNEADAEDAAQEAFLRAFKAIGDFRDDAPFRPWISRIALNVALNTAKAKRRRLKLIRAAPEPTHTGQNAFSEELDAALAKLKPRERLSLELFHRDRVTYAEIAEVLDANVAQVKNFLHRGREKLKSILRKSLGS